MRRPVVLALAPMLALSAVAAPSAAQQAPPRPPVADEQAAFAALQQRRWAEARGAFDRLVKAEPQNGRLWLRLGFALAGEGRPAEARAAFREALARDFNAAGAHLGIARSWARERQADSALAHLHQAALAGAAGGAALRADSALAPLADDPRFARALAVADSVRYPCRHRPEYRAFDFWIGDWDVLVGGTVVGPNRVDQRDEGCVLLENWTANAYQAGTSLNAYDPALRKWRQVYVWDAGRVTDWIGERQGDEMRFTADARTPAGQPVKQRMVFRAVARDTVTQVIDQSSDGGATWMNVWNSVYVRRPRP
jgi:tetratricopeptide (TPR) repeat protein